LVLYSEGGADYYPFGTDFLRGTQDRAADAAIQLGWDSLEAISASLTEVGADTHLATPGQVFQIGGGLI
jgi:hypothetical protein